MIFITQNGTPQTWTPALPRFALAACSVEHPAVCADRPFGTKQGMRRAQHRRICRGSWPYRPSPEAAHAAPDGGQGGRPNIGRGDERTGSAPPKRPEHGKPAAIPAGCVQPVCVGHCGHWDFSTGPLHRRSCRGRFTTQVADCSARLCTQSAGAPQEPHRVLPSQTMNACACRGASFTSAWRRRAPKKKGSPYGRSQ